MGVLVLMQVALLARVCSAAEPPPMMTASSAVPACRPRTDCRLASFTPREFYYEVNGEQVIISFRDEQYFSVWCDSSMFGAGGAAAAADSRALPALPRAAAVPRAELAGCRLPAGALAAALAALNVSATTTLDLTLNHNDTLLRRRHFAGLNVKSLIITGVDVDLSTEEDFLTDVKGLQSLELYGVRLTEKARRNLPVTLTKLILNGALSATPVSSLQWLERLRSLRVLTLIEESQGEPLTPPLLGQFPNLTDVLLQAPLTVPPGWLAGAPLKSLTLNACGLADLPDDMFRGVNLTSLSLTGNNLTSPPPGLIASQRWLRSLDVSRCGLRGAALARLVGSLERLELLRASHNPLGSLCGDADYTYKARSLLPRSLRRLELRGSRASRVCADWVDDAAALAHIDLSLNDIETLTYASLEMQRAPRHFDGEVQLLLTDNPLRDVDVTPRDEAACRAAAAAPPADRDTLARAPVRLSLSALRCDCSNARLRSLLAACPLVRLEPAPCRPRPPAPAPAPAPPDFLDYRPEQLLCECPADYNFNVSGCTCGKRLQDNATVVECAGRVAAGARWPPSDARRPLALAAAGAGLAALPAAALLELRAANNSITALRPEDIDDTLLVLDLRNNSIAHISVEAARRLGGAGPGGRPRRVWLAGNPLACACADRRALESLKSARVQAQVLDWKELRCRDGREISAITPSELCWNPLIPAILGAAALVLALGLATPPALRWARPQLKQFLFDRQLCLGWVLRADEPDDADKTHDVFISYAYADRALALELRRRLEAAGLRTLEHSRDWAAGVPVGEHIARSVGCARRTLLLVSDSFAESAWGLQEFRAAHALALRRGARLLPVRAALSDPARLPPDLRLYLRHHTYLAADDPDFWDKLLRVLPPPAAAAP